MKSFAYLDPGTGSIIIQAIIGTVVGVSYFLRKNIRILLARIKDIVSKRHD